MNNYKPLRTCTGCGRKQDAFGVFRILRTPGFWLLIDVEAEKHCRGGYVCSREGRQERALKERRFELTLKVHVPPGVREEARRKLHEISSRRASRGG